ncbi:MAG: Signal transduction histidine kinase, partial [Candidatus Lokiarchaeum sp. GC14_75]
SQIYIKIEFKDNGIGISDKRKGWIFKPDSMESKKGKGMGFGLSLVKKILEFYNGKIWVEDRIKGDNSQGSNFVLIIPIEDEK